MFCLGGFLGEGFVDIVCGGAVKVLGVHGLGRDDFLVLRGVRFPHGRADVVIYGLCGGLYVLPLGVGVGGFVGGEEDFLRQVGRVREVYEYAFTHIYLAVGGVWGRGVVEGYLEGLGYGFLRVVGGDVEVDVVARPRRGYGSGRDYCEVASRGLLMMVARRALVDFGFRVEDVYVSSVWAGLNWPLNYCAFLRGNYAVFGVYASNLEGVRRLLDFLMGDESLLEGLVDSGYRIFLESSPDVRGVGGYVYSFDEPLSIDVVKGVGGVMGGGGGLALVEGWRVGLGVYKRLWDVNFVPTYPTALKYVGDVLVELEAFRKLFQN